MTIIVSVAAATSTPFASLVNEVVPLVPECPRPIIEQVLRDACRDFFSTSRCWRQRGLTLLTTVANQEAYTANPPANAEVLEVMAAWNGDEEVEVGLPGEEDDAYPDENDTEFRVAVGDDGTTLTLSPLPETAGVVIKGSLSYTLASNATGIPTWVYNEYRRGLASGAAALLVMQPNKPWTDRQAYALHQTMFDKAVRDASNKAGPIRRRPLRSVPW
jgi:hypothetical protein